MSDEKSHDQGSSEAPKPCRAPECRITEKSPYLSNTVALRTVRCLAKGAHDRHNDGLGHYWNDDGYEDFDPPELRMNEAERDPNRYEPDRAKRCLAVQKDGDLMAVCNRTKGHPDEHERWSYTGIRTDIWPAEEACTTEATKCGRPWADGAWCGRPASHEGDCGPATIHQVRRNAKGDQIRIFSVYGHGSGGSLFWVSLENDLQVKAPNGQSEQDICERYPWIVQSDVRNPYRHPARLTQADVEPDANALAAARARHAAEIDPTCTCESPVPAFIRCKNCYLPIGPCTDYPRPHPIDDHEARKWIHAWGLQEHPDVTRMAPSLARLLRDFYREGFAVPPPPCRRCERRKIHVIDSRKRRRAARAEKRAQFKELVRQRDEARAEAERLRSETPLVSAALSDALEVVNGLKYSGYESVDDSNLPDDPERERAEEIESLGHEIEDGIRAVAKRYGATLRRMPDEGPEPAPPLTGGTDTTTMNTKERG